MRSAVQSLVLHPVSIAAIIFAAGCAAIGLFLFVASPILFALALSAIIYAALSPSVESLVRRDMHVSVAISLVMVIVVLLMVGISSLLYPAVSQQFDQFAARLDQLDNRIFTLCNQLNSWATDTLGFSFDPAETATSLLQSLNNSAAAMEASVTSYFSEVTFSLVLVPLITFFLLRDYRVLRNKTLQNLPNRYFELGWIIYNVATGQLHSYARGIFIQTISMSLICTFGFWMVGIDYAPVLGVLVGLLNLIPFFGISLAKVPPVLVVLLSDNPDILMIVLALAVVFAAQTVDTVYLLPKVVAKSANLHPLTVMIGVMLGGYYFGFIGLVLSVPVLFSMKVIYLDLLRGIRDYKEAGETRPGVTL